MIEKNIEKVLLGVVIVGLGAIGLELNKIDEKLKKIDEKLDNQFNNRNGYYTLKESNRRFEKALRSIREEREKKEDK